MLKGTLKEFIASGYSGYGSCHGYGWGYAYGYAFGHGRGYYDGDRPIEVTNHEDAEHAA